VDQGIRNSKNRTAFISTKSESWCGGNARAESAATARITRFSAAVHREFYGTTEFGGAENRGTVFSLSVGLGPFVETQTTSGKMGAAVKILGTNLTGASSVTFNGTAATFTVVSKSEIQTTVPTGATSGYIKVTTPGGMLTSNVVYTVKP
jgi:hypothetical protein